MLCRIERIIQEVYGMGASTSGEMACCFTGHRVVPTDRTEELRQRLRAGIAYLCDAMSITTYYAGGALGFDSLAAEAVIEQRGRHPNLRLVIVVPCRDQAARWSAEQKARYERINRDADEVICLAEHYFNGCMHQRNRYMVDHSAYCICYLTEQTGGTAYTVQYAREHGLRIFNLAHPKGGTR